MTHRMRISSDQTTPSYSNTQALPSSEIKQSKSIHTVAAQVFNYIAESRLAELYEKHQPLEIIFHVKHLFDSVYEISEQFSKTVKVVSETAKNFCKSQKIINGLFNCTYFTSLLSAPFAIHKICKCAMKIFSKSTLMQKVDAGIALGVTFSELTEAAVYIAQGLEKFGAVAAEAIKWTTNVTIASVVLSSAVVFANIRGWYKTHTFLKNVDSKLKNDKDHKNAIDSLVNDKKSGKFLKAKKEQLEVIKTYTQNVQEPSKLEKLYEKLRYRVKTKIFSHKVAIVVAVISLIASTILLATPLGPIAYAIMAIGALILIGKYVDDRIEQKNFSKLIKELESEKALSPIDSSLTPEVIAPPRNRVRLVEDPDETLLPISKMQSKKLSLTKNVTDLSVNQEISKKFTAALSVA